MVKHSTNDLLTDINDSRKETVFMRNDIISFFLLEFDDGKSMRYVAVNVYQIKIDIGNNEDRGIAFDKLVISNVN